MQKLTSLGKELEDSIRSYRKVDVATEVELELRLLPSSHAVDV
jgi:hypothetical protein